MRWSVWRLVVLVLVAVVTVACDAKVTEPSDKNTNWLRQCSASEQCGVGLQCLCGVCTSVCDRDEQCGDQSEDAVCAELSGARCGPAPVQVCSARCDGTLACGEIAEGLECSAGVCTPATALTSNDGGEPDASMPPADAGAPASDGGSTVPPPAAIDESISAAVASSCVAPFSCEARAAEPGDVVSFVVDDAETLSWLDFGSVDDLGNHQLDGAVVRLSKAGGAPERVFGDLDRPFKHWRDGDSYYWLSGDPADFEGDRGLQTFYEAPRDASAGAPMALGTGLYRDLQVDSGAAMWFDPYENDQGIQSQLQYSVLSWQLSSWTSIYVTPDPYELVAMADATGYLERGGESIVSVGPGGMLTELLADPPGFLISPGDDELWLVHAATDGVEWVGWMPRTGGAVTHIARAGSYVGRPLAGASVVWQVRIEPASTTFELWSIPQAGGEPAMALRWPTKDEQPREAAAAPVWIADGDSAWVYGWDTVIHVRHP